MHLQQSVTPAGKCPGWRVVLALGTRSRPGGWPLRLHPVALVKLRNLARRHLTGSQRAAAIVACNEWASAGRPFNSAPGALLMTGPEMAKEADVSLRTIVQAKLALTAGLVELVAVWSARVGACGDRNLRRVPPLG